MKKKAGQAQPYDRSSSVRNTSLVPANSSNSGKQTKSLSTTSSKSSDEYNEYGFKNKKSSSRKSDSSVKKAETKDTVKKSKPAKEKSAAKNTKKTSKSKKEKKSAAPVLAVITAILAVGAGIFAYLYFTGFFKPSIEVTLADGTVEEIKAEEAYAELMTDRFFQGTVIDGIEVGGMTIEEAVSAVSVNQPEAPMEVHVSLDLEGMFIPIDFSDAGFEYNTREICEKAFAQFRPENDFDFEQLTACYNGMQALKNTPQTYETAYTVKIENVSQKVHAALDPLYDEYALVVNAEITDFDTENRQFVVTPDKTGYIMDIDGTADLVKAMFDSKDYTGTVKVITTVEEPTVTVQMINDEFGLIGEHSTKTSNNSNRNNNIRQACDNMNGHIVQPGEEFSFNGVVGQRTSANGFKEATVIQGGQYEQGLGGGICQVSSTLYNAVLKADLEVVKRSGHAWPSDYVPVGLDATVDWPALDFVFKNTTDSQIVVVAWWDSSDSTCHCQIYGKKLPDGQYIKLESEIISTVPAGAPEYVEDKELPAGQRKSLRAAHNGQTARVYKVWYDKDGNEIKREEYYTTSYKAYGERIAVGTLLPDGTYAQFDPATGEVITPTPTPDPTDTQPTDIQPTDVQPTDTQPTDTQATDAPPPPPEETQPT